jgi:uncharacterized protein
MSDPDSAIRIPLFPLPDAVVFPTSRLPLHVFEPRYRQMTEDVLAGDGLIGMVLIQSGADPGEERPPIYGVGCAGEIQQSRRLSDGRFLIELEGRFRFRILREEESSKPYRIAIAVPLPELSGEPPSGVAPDARNSLDFAYAELEARMLELMRLSAQRGDALLRQQLPRLSSTELINALSAGIDCSPGEKQDLLEASGPLERCRRLAALIQFRIAELQFPTSTRVVN